MLYPDVHTRPYVPGKYQWNCTEGQREREISKPLHFTIIRHVQQNTQFGKLKTTCQTDPFVLILKTQGMTIMSLLLNWTEKGVLMLWIVYFGGESVTVWSDQLFLLCQSSCENRGVGSHWRKLDTSLVRCVGYVADFHALREIQDCFTRLNNTNKDVRAIVLASEGTHFRYKRLFSCFPTSQIVVLKVRCSIV